MRTLSIALCDDDNVFRSRMAVALTEALARCGWEADLRESDCAKALSALIGIQPPQLIFLDIDMPGLDGIRFGEMLRSGGCGIDIIYVSNMDEKVYEIFRVHPWCFIRKSRFFEEIDGIIREYTSALESRPATVLLQDINGKQEAFGPEDILYVEAVGKTQELHRTDSPGIFAVRCSMHELEQTLSAFGFLRIHKGFLVNFRSVRKITSRNVLLDNGQELPIGRDRLKSAREQYLAQMKWKGTAYP